MGGVAGERRGCTREKMLSYQDGESKNPLHSAVNAGNLLAVCMCLENGASIDAQQDDQATAVHLACAQGNVDIVKAMFEKQPDKARLVVFMTDIQEMAPLHKAAMFDRVEIADLLLSWGAEMETRDKQQRTPLLLAVSRAAWRTARLLVLRGANAMCRDDAMRNILHLCILSGGAPQDIGCSTLHEGKQLLNEQDADGCTPLHYASKGGQLQAIEALILNGASISPKNRQRRCPLHFAARYGRFNTCKRLLSSALVQGILNDADSKGLTSLHLAAKCGHYRVVQLLLQKGAVIFRDLEGNTPLHLAAKNGFVKTVELILQVHAYLLDAGNKAQDTSLHLAASAGHEVVVSSLLARGCELAVNEQKQTFLDCAIEAKNKDVCLAVVHSPRCAESARPTLRRWEEAMSLRSEQFVSPLLGMVQHLPECVTAVLDRCHSASERDPRHVDYWEKFDFRLLIEDGPEGSPLFPLLMMVRFGRTECLSHPVCEHLLRAKWLRYGLPLHVANLLVYLLFVAVLTALVTTYEPPLSASSVAANCSSWHAGCPLPVARSRVSRTPCAIVLVCFCALSMLKEVAQMAQQRGKYLLDANNYLEWVLYLATLALVAPFLAGDELDWQAGSVAIFLAWFNLFLYLQRFGVLGIYVVMFLEILRTLVAVIVVFALLIVAFGLAFFVLMGDELHQAHAYVGLSLLRTSVMMLGEMDFLTTFVDPFTDGNADTMRYETLTVLFLAVFLLLMPILLMNLLIGLAVGDIESVQRNAVLKRLAMQVEMHSDLEKKLPRRVHKYIRIDERTLHPNRTAFGLQSALSRLTAIGARSDSRGHTDAFEPGGHSHFLQQELFKQKRRLKAVSTALDRQYALLRLVVQKMDIHAVADELDETSHRDSDALTPAMRGWNRPAVRRVLFRRETPSAPNTL